MTNRFVYVSSFKRSIIEFNKFCALNLCLYHSTLTQSFLFLIIIFVGIIILQKRTHRLKMVVEKAKKKCVV